MKSNYDTSQNVLTFEELLINNKELYSEELDEETTKIEKPEVKKKMKVILN